MVALWLVVALAARGEVVSPDVLAARINELHRLTGERVLLGAAGSDAEFDLKRWLKKRPWTQVELTRVATIGDPEDEMSRALQQAGLPCAIRAVPNGSLWEITEHGACHAVELPVDEPEADDATLLTLAGLTPQVKEDEPGPADIANNVFPVGGECFPPCSPGYFCHEGACTEACNPPCGEGRRCTGERICVAEAGATIAADEPAGKGRICVYRERKFGTHPVPWAPWAISVDGRRKGTIAGGEYLCFAVDAGSQQLMVEGTVSGGWGGSAVAPFAPPVVTRMVSVQVSATKHYVGEMNSGVMKPELELHSISGGEASKLKQELRPGDH